MGTWASRVSSLTATQEKVLRTIPKEKLLIFNFSDGWGPLCKFLNKTVPDGPLPYVDRFAHKSAWVHLVQREAVRLRRKEL